MSEIRPFRGLRPSADKVSQVASVPYDVINVAEAREMAQGNPLSFLHVSRPEIDLDPEIDPHSELAYRHATVRFSQLVHDCPLIQESQPALYLYRLNMNGHEQTGVVGCFSIDEYDSNKIKKHERTRPDKEDDRTQHILALSAQTGPVFLAYSDLPELNEEMERIKSQESPLYDFVAADGVSHTLWRISQTEKITALFSQKISSLYIADGHHRAAAASRARAALAARNPSHSGDEEYNYVYGVAFPGSQLQILPYNRVVKDLNGLTKEAFLDSLKTCFEVVPAESPRSIPKEFGMYFNGQWFQLKLKKSVDHSITNFGSTSFDVDVLQESLLCPILGIKDPRLDQRIEFVGGIRGIPELERLVDTGSAVVAFSIHPIQLSDLMRVADQGGIMPPKSTWFEPKLRDGIISHSI